MQARLARRVNVHLLIQVSHHCALEHGELPQVRRPGARSSSLLLIHTFLFFFFHSPSDLSVPLSQTHNDLMGFFSITPSQLLKIESSPAYVFDANPRLG